MTLARFRQSQSIADGSLSSCLRVPAKYCLRKFNEWVSVYDCLPSECDIVTANELLDSSDTDWQYEICHSSGKSYFIEIGK